MRKSPLTIVAAILVLLCCNVVFGFDPLGPPKATLTQGQPSLGIEYLYGNMDLKSFGTPFLPEVFSPTTEASRINLNDVVFNKISGIVGYGLSDRLEIFGRFGVAAVDVDNGANADHFGGLIGSSDFDFFVGGGARATIFEWENISVGVLAQVSVVQLERFNDYSVDYFGDPVTVSSELTMTEVQLAFGPTWNCTENFSIYGGPFLHFVDGNLDRTAVYQDNNYPDRLDISERGVWGGYIGATVLFCKSPNINCNVEFQASESGYGVAIQLAISP